MTVSQYADHGGREVKLPRASEDECEDAIIEAAIERADRDCEQGVRDLEHEAASAPEWSAGFAFNGSRYIDPKRAKLTGMLAFLRGDR